MGFIAVFFPAAVALVPAHRPEFFMAIVGGCAIIGAGVSLFVTVQLWRNDWTPTHPAPSRLCAVATLAYLVLLIAAALIWKGNDIAFDVLAGALLPLLVIDVRNARDLTPSMVQRHSPD